jgi:hypothetical protein
MADKEMTLEELYVEMDKRIKAANDALLVEIKKLLEGYQPKKEGFKITRKEAS